MLAQSPEDYIVKPREAIPKKQWTEDNMTKPSERVSILEPVIAKTHTTFYNKQKPGSVAQQEKVFKEVPVEMMPSADDRAQWKRGNHKLPTEKDAFLHTPVANYATTYYA